MGNKKIPYLCGGTLFFLLVQAKKQRNKAREREKGQSDGLSDLNIMEGLIEVVTGSQSTAYSDSLKKNTSQFRECIINSSTYIPFEDVAIKSRFDEEIRHDYKVVLVRMNTFLEKFFDRSRIEWVVQVLLHVLDLDVDIIDTDVFYAQSNGEPLSRDSLLQLSKIEVQAFFLGILHFIIMKRSGKNTLGKETLDSWGVKNPKRERKLKDNFSFHKKFNALFLWSEVSGMNVDKESRGHVHSEFVESEYLDDETNFKEQTQKQESVMTNQVVFINNGGGPQFMNNYASINITNINSKESKD